MTDTHSVELLPNNQIVHIQNTKSLFHQLRDAQISVPTACGGKGTCHLCRIQVQAPAGSINAPSPLEKRALGNVLIAQGIRLACQVFVAGPQVQVTVLPDPSKKA